MFRTVVIGGFAVATLIGGVALATAPSTAVQASAPSAKSDRLDTRRADDKCSQHAWPYYPSDCIRDGRRLTGKASEVRFVVAGYLPSAATRNSK
ncbi:MAG TPA: hypothetical protein VEC94_14480 [Pseudolabrys sp.]|nr:hypothetical protein [Pseudolabrys sp.]